MIKKRENGKSRLSDTSIYRAQCRTTDYGSVLQCVYPRVWTGARAKTQTLSSASAPLTNDDTTVGR
jgi:hypothetical protein